MVKERQSKEGYFNKIFIVVSSQHGAFIFFPKSILAINIFWHATKGRVDWIACRL